MPPLLNYTTTVAASKTIAEMQEILVKHGADSVAVSYTDGQPSALAFVLVTPHGRRAFVLPANIPAVHRLLQQRRRAGKLDRNTYTTPEHAARVGWRILKDWLQAQLAILQSQMVTLDQIMLPYLRVEESDGRQVTLYDRYVEHEQAALAIGGAA